MREDRPVIDSQTFWNSPTSAGFLLKSGSALIFERKWLVFAILPAFSR
jgi:hypothetical protein